MKTKTREEWLMLASKEMFKSIFAKENVPSYRVSCGLPTRNAFSKRKRTIGICFSAEASKDKHHEIFISPTLSEAFEVLDCLAHELIHAIVGTKEGHGGAFRRLAKEIGFQGKMTQTTAGPELAERLNVIHKKLGDYPHSKLDGLKLDIKKQGTRLIKLECHDCGYILRTTAKWIEVGHPTCCCGGDFE